MKKIFNLLVVFSLVFIYSCDNYNNSDFDTEDQLTGTAKEGGAILAVDFASNGKLLGIPSSLDFETATVAITENILDMKVNLMSGGDKITGYQITKNINGGAETVVAESATLPIAIQYSTLDQFLSGLGIVEDDLRIGDVIYFRTKMIRSDGSAVYAGPNEGSFNLTVSCSSDLAQTYDALMHYIRTSTGTDTWYEFEDTFTELKPGVYRTEEVGPWIGGLGVGVPGYTMVDICGAITVPEQNLVEYYSNLVAGAGYVDGVTGKVYVDYTICATDCRECYAVYTPID